MRVVLFAPDDPPASGTLAAGPGIRYAEMAAELRRSGLEVVLLAPGRSPEADGSWTGRDVRELCNGADAVIVGQGHVQLGSDLARLLPPRLPVVVDAYAPLLVENLALVHDRHDVDEFEGLRRPAVELLRRGDLFLVANRRQWLYTLGLLSAIGRLNPLTYEAPPLLTIGYGVPDAAPEDRDLDVRQGIAGEGEPLAMWYGGVYPWFDATTAIRGFARALERIPAARLVIVGGRHPRAHAPSQELERALAASVALGIEDRVAQAPWLPYADRTAWYAAADCAICLHHAGPETELAHRTRLLDLIWGRVPLVASRGDAVGEWAESAGAAICVEPGDAEAAGDALVRFLGDEDARRTARTAAGKLAVEVGWAQVVSPLVEWLRAPATAADRFEAGVGWRAVAVDLVEAIRERRRRATIGLP